METLFEALKRLTEEGRPFVLATVVASKGSTPQKPGSKLVVLSDATIGTVGGGAIEHQIIAAARELLADGAATTRLLETHLTHELGMCCGGAMSVFLEKHGAPAQLWVFGAGHVAQALAALAATVGFVVRVVDERAEWASSARFPQVAQVVVRHPAEVAKELVGGPDAYFCIATHDHPLDQACLEALVRKPSAYLGVIGSRRKAERFRMRLLAAGFTEAELARVRSPMGVFIGALTPAEIAVSIVGELIAVRRGVSGARGSDTAVGPQERPGAPRER